MKNLLTSESTNLPLPLIIIGAAILFVIICAVVVIIVLSARKNKKKKVINKSGDWLMALGGKENIKDETIERIAAVTTPDERKAMLTEARYATAWIYENIRKICR